MAINRKTGNRAAQKRLDPLMDWRWYLLVVSAYLIGLVSLGIALRHNLGFPLDDSWIHQVIARNLVRFHTFGFTPGVASSGSSSTLWTLILALNYLLFPHISPVIFALILNSVLLISCGILLWQMAVRDGLPRAEALALAILPGLSGNLVWLAFTGMEHVLFMMLSLLAIVLWFRQDGTAKPSVYAGLALGALGMTRPEGLVLSLLLFALYKRCGRSVADVIRAAGLAAIFLLSSFLLNLKTSGSLLPTTLRGRRYLYTGSDRLHFGRASLRALTGDTYKRIISHHFFNSTGWWVAVFVVLAFYGVFVLLRRFPNRTSMLCFSAVVQYACYCVMLPAAGHGGRYQPFVLLLFPSVMAIALIDIVTRGIRIVSSQKTGIGLQWAAMLLISAMTAATLPRWEVALRDNVFDMNASRRKLAYWINDHYPPGTKMAVSEIGAIGYFAHIDLLDLGGLVDQHFLPYLMSGRVPEYLDARDVKYVVLSHMDGDPKFGEMFHLSQNPAIRLVPLDTEGIDGERWLSSNQYTQNGYPFQTLYRIDHVPLREQSVAATAMATAIAAHARPDSEMQIPH